jgi:hypothetical protein
MLCRNANLARDGGAGFIATRDAPKLVRVEFEARVLPAGAVATASAFAAAGF